VIARVTPNKSLQMRLDPLPTFAFAKARIASNAPVLKRHAHSELPANISRDVEIVLRQSTIESKPITHTGASNVPDHHCF
jgi:hypothetical protein